jgi:hypothetical protein
LKNYRAGLHNVGSYQVSGLPWVTGSTLAAAAEDKISFPSITKSFTVFNNGANPCRVHFVPASAGNVIGGLHFITIPPSAYLPLSHTFNVKCKEVYISSVAGTDYELIAELTTIAPDDMYTLTGSGTTD